MPDIGVLSIQIKSDASQAAQSLKDLAGALRSIEKIVGQATSGLSSFASSLKAVEKAVGESKGYLTLSRIATSIEKVKTASQGFKTPDFSRLESLMRALQDNFNAESGLKRIAEGMEAIKAASQGFKMPSTKEMEKIAIAASSAMTAETTQGVSQTGTKGEAMSGFQKVESTVQEVSENMSSTVSENTVPSLEQVNSTVNEISQSEEEELRRIEEIIAARREEYEACDKINKAIEEKFNAGNRKPMSIVETNAMADNLTQLDLLKAQLRDAEQQYNKLVNTLGAGDTKTIKAGLAVANLKDKIWELKKAEEEAATAAKSNVPQGMESVAPTVQGPVDSTESMGLYSKTLESIVNGTYEAKQAADSIDVDKLMEYKTLLDVLIEKREILKTEMAEGIESGDWGEKKINSAMERLIRLNDQIDKYKDKLDMANDNTDMSITGEAALTAADDFMKTHDAIALVQMQIDMLKEKLGRGIMTGTMDQNEIIKTTQTIQNLTEKLEKLKQEQEEVAKSAGVAERAMSGFSSLMSALKQTIKGSWLGKLAKQFTNIAKRMAIRAVIKQITGAFKEGVENVYRYSEAIGSSFAPAMDQTASLLKQMKNSIGAALAPAIQAVLPYINQLVNAFITAVNWVNQFFALLNGQNTWTKALPVTAKAFEDQKKQAKGASNAMKDLLADWDELNIIQSQGGSGSGSSTDAEDYASMFTQVATFENSARDVAAFVKDVIGFVKENFGFILGAALGVKTAMRAWKLSSALSSSLPFLSKLLGGLAVAATIGLTIAITDLTGKNYIATGDPGWLIADALTGAVGATLAGSLAQKLIGGTAGTVTAGFTLILAGLTNIMNATSAFAQKKEAEGWMLGVLGSVESGIGAGLLIKGLGATGFTLAGGAVVALAAIAITLGCSVALAEDNIEWGTVELTPEQVKQYVQTQFFTGIDVDATINLVKATIDKVSVTKADLEAQVAGVIPILTTLKLGIDDEQTYKDLKTAVFGDGTGNNTGVIGRVQAYATANVQELKTSISLIPIVNSSGEDVSAKFLSKGIEGWDEVTRYTNQIGQDLAKELSKGFTEDGLANFDEDAVKAMTEKLVRISKIVTGAQVEAAAESQLSIDLSNLKVKDLNQETVHEVAKVFNDYKGELRKEYEMIYKEAATQYLTLSRFYDEMARDAKTDEEKKHWLGKAAEYKEMYDEAVENMEGNVTAAVERASAPGVEQMRDFLQEKFAKAFNSLSDHFDYNGVKSGTGIFWDIIGNPDYGVDTAEKPAAKVEENAKAWNKALAGWLGNENVFLKGILAEMPELNVWSLMTEQMQADFRQVLAARYGEEYADELIKQWVGNVPEVAAEAVEEAKAEVAKMESDTPAAVETPTVPSETQETVKETAESVQQVSEAAVEAKQNVVALDELTFDTTGVETSADTAASAIEDMASRIRNAFATLDGLSYEMDINGQKYAGAMKVLLPTVQQRASGGFVRSGDLVMANENGNFEMMGKMGNQPVVANNQQIVSGISQGVAQANSGVESRLTTIETLLNRILQKEFVARAVPGSDWGNHNAKSAEAYGRVTG